MALIMQTSSTFEPVSLAEVKEFLRIDIDDDDDLIERLITVARREVENKCKRQLGQATWKYILYDFPCSTCSIELPRPPLSTLTSNVSIQYTDSNNTTQTVAATVYTVDYENQPKGRLFPAYNNEWPNDVLDHPKSVQITYVTGYTAKELIPEDIKHYIKMRVGDMYENREAQTTERLTNVGFFDRLLDPWMVDVYD